MPEVTSSLSTANDAQSSVPSTKTRSALPSKATTTPKTPLTPPTTQPETSTPVKSVRKKRASKMSGLLVSAIDTSHDSEMDPELLKLSRAMRDRKPLGEKPLPAGKPEVWATGRTELCETLMYYKAHKGGCYMNRGTVYCMMFDGCKSAREYMDENVIIARSGGKMGDDDDTGAYTQTHNHTYNHAQPQAVLNNMVHQNPVVIICGNKNTSSVTEMPHRYNVLGYFKITHTWMEKTAGNRGQVMETIKYRFEKLDRSIPAWNAPAELRLDLPTSSDCPMISEKCASCHKVWPQVYLLDWTCLTEDCSEHWERLNGKGQMPLGDLDHHPGFILHETRWPVEIPPLKLTSPVPETGNVHGDHLTYLNTRGVTCPKCGRCCNRYLYDEWKCDTPKCGWRHEPIRSLIDPGVNFGGNLWNLVGDNGGIASNTAASCVGIKVSYWCGYKVICYTLDTGMRITTLRSNKEINALPGGADDMFRTFQQIKMGLERRKSRGGVPIEGNDLNAGISSTVEPEDDGEDSDSDDEEGDGLAGGDRMQAHTGNYGMEYEFAGVGASTPFEEAPDLVNEARAFMNYIARAVVSDTPEELVSDDGEES
ncbi:hypothetical protein LTR95_019019, partial [Oleoguttula sp. CCFEE 5521]